jgi:hypothetical protein
MYYNTECYNSSGRGTRSREVFYQNAKLANAMHNMLSIGIDYGRALHTADRTQKSGSAPTPTHSWANIYIVANHTAEMA